MKTMQKLEDAKIKERATKDFYMSLSEELRHEEFIKLFGATKRYFKDKRVRISDEDIIADITKMLGTYKDYMAMIGWYYSQIYKD